LTKDGQKSYIFDPEPKILGISVQGLSSICPCSIPVGLQESVLPKEMGFGLAKTGVSRLALFRVVAVTRQWKYSGINK